MTKFSLLYVFLSRKFTLLTFNDENVKDKTKTVGTITINLLFENFFKRS